MARYILGIDAGGTAVKAAVYSLTGEERGVTSQALRPITPEPGHYERDPELLWSALCAVIRASMAKAGVTGDDIATVGLTGHGNGFYFVDAADRPIGNGVLSSDLRTAPMVKAWRAEGREKDHIARALKPIWYTNTPPLLAWFKRNRPNVLAAADAVLPCKDYLRLRLTGERFAELTDQSTSTIVNGFERKLDPALFALAGVSELIRLIPPAIEPTAIAGTITAEAAAATGLKAGTPVPAGCTDNNAVMLGTGAIENGQMIIMSGTWGLHQVYLDYALADGNVGFICHAIEPKRWLYCEGSPTSASSFEWFVDTFLRQPGSAEPAEQVYERCNAAIAQTDPEEPPVFFLPFLNGAYDNSNARAALVGFATWHRLGHAVRAIYEGVAFEHHRHYERLVKAFPRPSRARFCGGAARSRAWAEIFASALDLTLDVPHGSEFGARGAAMLAGVACGLFADIPAAAKAMTSLSHAIAPDSRLRTILDARYPIYRHLHESLAAHWRETAG